ncbi:kinase-like domain-containing protein [Rhizophagus clarus]|uniref:Kinase-like domain-containing protein n=1 Tax=Rhizophagus clarus TaxID=94130 RepID=A0A8H3MKM1_9GLOM|nr:kinase-like domain-containing protein [Rhizophagus clarus]
MSTRSLNISILSENHFIITNELVGLLDNVYLEIKKHKILNYFNSCNVTLQEFYNWLLSNQEDSNLVVLLGIFNHLGIETEVDEQNAADLGNSTSICNLGYCYQYGIGTNMDKERAFITFQKAANLGNACGIYNLGHCYRYGIGIIKNYPKSVVLYQNAADLGDALAQYFLAMIYERGEEDIIDIDTYHIDLIYGAQYAHNKLNELKELKKRSNLNPHQGLNLICYIAIN